MPPAKPVFATRALLWGVGLLVLGAGLTWLVWAAVPRAAPSPTITHPPAATPTRQMPSATSRPPTATPAPAATIAPTPSRPPLQVITPTTTATASVVNTVSATAPPATNTPRRVLTATPHSPSSTPPPPTEVPPTPPPVPNAPSDLNLTFTSPVVVITWKDNSNDEVGFNLIYRVDEGPELAVMEPYIPANMTSAPLARLFMCESVETTHTVTAVINAFNEVGTSATIENALTFTVLACPPSTAPPPSDTPEPTAPPG